MIINTLSSDPAVSLELGRRITLSEERLRLRRLHPSPLSAMWDRLFARHSVKLIRAHG